MNLPLLPHDNIKKVLFFGGLALVIFLLSFQNDLYKDYHEKFIKYTNKISEAKSYQIESDEILKKFNEEIDSVGKELSKKDLTSQDLTQLYLVIKQNKLKKENWRQMNDKAYAELESEQNNFQYFMDDFELKVKYLNRFLPLFFIITCLALFSWSFTEQKEEDERIRIVNKNTKNIPCQSCGMILKYDLHPHMEDEFCSKCYDGEKFIEVLTFVEMNNKIKTHMKEQGLSEKDIKKQISKLKKLNRWSLEFKW